MFLIFTLLIVLIFINYPQSNSSGLLRIDYFESLSNPIECLVFYHYYPTGPLFLFVSFDYKLYSYIFGYVFKYIAINALFTKKDEKCNNSIIFTTIGKDFKKLEIKIFIYLFYNYALLTYSNYTIYHGVSPGFYKLWDIDQHFSIYTKIVHDVKNYLIISELSLNYIEFYLNSISKSMRDICISTENNNAVVLETYGSIKPEGLVVGFEAYFFIGEELFTTRYYPAFECNKNLNYPNEPLILIIDQHKFDIYFKLIYSKLFKGKVHSTAFKLHLKNVIFNNFNDLENISKRSTKLFVTEYNSDIIECSDGTKRLKYSSYENITYYVTERKIIKISPYIEKTQHISHSLTDQC